MGFAILGGLAWLLILGVYFALWTALAVWMSRIQRRRALSFAEWDGTPSLFAMNVLVIAMPLFVGLNVLIYVPFTMQVNGHDVEIKPRLIEGTSLSTLASAGLALSIACAIVLALRRRSQRASG
jgi:hypothetical protein